MSALNLVEIDTLLWLHRLWQNPVCDLLARGLDWVGDQGRIFLLLAVVLLCIRPTRPYGVILAAALVLDALVVNITLKPLVGRVRPYDASNAIAIIVPREGDLSFPSGHTAVAFAAAAALRPLGRAPAWAALAFAVLMGLSRLYLMVHYPTDVLAGALAGWLCGLAAVWGWKKWFRPGRAARL